MSNYNKAKKRIADKIRYSNKKNILNKQHREWLLNPINKERALKRAREYKKENRDKINRQIKNRRQKDAEKRISDNLRAYILKSLKRKSVKKTTKTFKLIGCDSICLKNHIESLWKNGMSWKNYGYYGWHIDHIRPCSSFNLKNIKEQKECFNYLNLQPLWRKDHLLKSGKERGKK